MENRLPKYWAVKNDGSQEFTDEVIIYMNSLCNGFRWTGRDFNNYYGVDGSVTNNGTFSNYDLGNCKNNPVLLDLHNFIYMKNSPKNPKGLMPKNWYVVATNENKELINKWYGTISTVGAKYGIFNGYKITRMYSLLENGHLGIKEENDWHEISTEDFIKYILKKDIDTKKIKGYKLLKDEYKIAAEEIGKCKLYENTILNIGCVSVYSLKRAGVLDLWFEPIYEQEYVTLMFGHKHIPVKIYNDKVEADGDIFPIVEFKMILKALSKITLVSTNNNKERPVTIKKFTIGCTDFTLDELKKVIDVSSKL